MSIKIITFFVCVTIGSIAIARENNAMFFSYQKVFDAQFACSKKHLSELNFDPIEKIELATRAWSIISNLKIEEHETKDINERKFRVTFIGVGHVECGEEISGLDSFCGEAMVETPVLKHSKKNPEKNDIFFDEAQEAIREGWGSYTWISFSSDMPLPPGSEGLSCLVTLENLIKNPQAINLDQLCEGRSKNDRQKTEKEIQKAIAIWKTRKCIE